MTMLDLIVERMSEPHRYWHSLQHITSMLKTAAKDREHINNPEVLFLAILFHDSVYSTKEGEYAYNEEKSINLMRIWFQIDTTDVDLDVVAIFIEATKTHDASLFKGRLTKEQYSDLQYFLDLDIEVFGSEDFDELLCFESCIRQEFKEYPDTVYYPRRIEVLRGFLKGKIFHHPCFLYRNTLAYINLSKLIQFLAS